MDADRLNLVTVGSLNHLNKVVNVAVVNVAVDISIALSGDQSYFAVLNVTFVTVVMVKLHERFIYYGCTRR